MADENERERWNERWTSGREETGEPLPFVLEALNRLDLMGLPRERTAIDVACGTGRNALFLARRGYKVLAVDISDVALERLAKAAAAEGLDVRTEQRDLSADGLPAGEFGVVLVTRYLDRQLFPALIAAVAPGGTLLVETFLASHAARTSFPIRYCLEPGELLRETQALKCVRFGEATAVGDAVAWLVAVQP